MQSADLEKILRVLDLQLRYLQAQMKAHEQMAKDINIMQQKLAHDQKRHFDLKSRSPFNTVSREELATHYLRWIKDEMSKLQPRVAQIAQSVHDVKSALRHMEQRRLALTMLQNKMSCSGGTAKEHAESLIHQLNHFQNESNARPDGQRQ